MMDTITGMRTFCAVAVKRSFIKAAQHLGISAALTSKYIAQLEERLGVRLLNRTTRSLSLTQTGSEYLSRCQMLLKEFDALEDSVQESSATPQGHLQISAPRILGENYLMEAIADFLAEHPKITIEVKLSDRFVNIVEEGFDLAIRGGALKDSSLISRKLASSSIVHCASPAYLKANGTPMHPNELTEHMCIIDSNFEGKSLWPFLDNGEKISVAVNGPITVNGVQACRRLALRGLGIMHAPSGMVAEKINAKKLIPILEKFDLSNAGLYVVYPHNRHLSVKVRSLVDFLVAYFAKNYITFEN